MRSFLILPALAAILLGHAGCGPGGSKDSAHDQKEAPPQAVAERVWTPREETAFRDRIRGMDPGQQKFESVSRTGTELAVVLAPSIEQDAVPALLDAALRQFSQELPGQTVTVIGYAPTTPPKKIGTARLDTVTREITYQPES